MLVEKNLVGKYRVQAKVLIRIGNGFPDLEVVGIILCNRQYGKAQRAKECRYGFHGW
jgi:hypothetical protein